MHWYIFFPWEPAVIVWTNSPSGTAAVATPLPLFENVLFYLKMVWKLQFWTSWRRKPLLCYFRISTLVESTMSGYLVWLNLDQVQTNFKRYFVYFHVSFFCYFHAWIKVAMEPKELIGVEISIFRLDGRNQWGLLPQTDCKYQFNHSFWFASGMRLPASSYSPKWCPK